MDKEFATTVEERDFYKEQYERLLKEKDRATLDAAYEETRRQLADENAAKELEFRTNIEKELLGVYRNRDHFRQALIKYGQHLSFCGQRHCSANPCTCGLAEAIKKGEVR